MYLTEQEAQRIAERVEAGYLDTFDNRTDGDLDHDPLGDSRRVGERIAAGFKIINSSEHGGAQ